MKDKIDIIKIVKENQVVALIISTVFIVIFIYILVFVPLANKLRIKYLECVGSEGQVADTRHLIEMGHKIDKEYGSRVLISEQQAAAGIEEFTRYGKSLGISFLSMKPQDIIKQESAQYKILPLELSFEASGEQFVKFIGTIDELKKVIVTVKSFNITPEAGDRKKLRVNMVINIYLSLEEGNSEGI